MSASAEIREPSTGGSHQVAGHAAGSLTSGQRQAVYPILLPPPPGLIPLLGQTN